MEDRALAMTYPALSQDAAFASARPGLRIEATREHEVIRRWAAEHRADPATGEATRSGPATIAVNDGGAGLRFNFPGFARFRPISWEEWLHHFDEHALLFLFETLDSDQVAKRAYAIFRARGGAPGHDRDDWFQAEREFRQRAAGGSPTRYWLVESPAELKSQAPLAASR